MIALPARRIWKHSARRSSLGGSVRTPTSERSRRQLATHPPPPVPARPVDLLLDAVALRFTDGYGAAAPLMRNALDLFRREAEDGATADVRWFWLAWTLAGELWDDVSAEDLATRAVRVARDAGALGHLPILLACRAGAHVTAGEFQRLPLRSSMSPARSLSDRLHAGGVTASGRLRAWRGSRPAARPTSMGGRQHDDAGRGTCDRSVQFHVPLSCTTTRPLRRGAGRRPPTCEHDQFGVHGLALEARSRLPCTGPRRGRHRGAAGSRGTDGAGGHRLGARRAGSLAAPCSPRAPPPTRSTSRRSNGSDEAGSSSISPVPIWCTADGSAREPPN